MRMRTVPTTRRGGFTLLELLVAITVLSIVALIAWRGLDSLTHTRERLLPEADQVRALLVTFGQMERDLSEVVNTAFVPLHTSPVNARGSGFDLIRFTPVAPGAVTTVQVVAYDFRDGQLVREASLPMASIGSAAEPRSPAVALLSDVRALKIRVWQPGRGWVPADAAVPDPTKPPPGLEIVLELADGKQYRRVLLPG
jgi:general secretion pathway protein J